LVDEGVEGVVCGGAGVVYGEFGSAHVVQGEEGVVLGRSWILVYL